MVELTPTCDSVTIESDGTCVEFEVTFSGEVCNNSTGLDSDLTNIVVTGPAGQITLSDAAGDGADVIASGDCETFTNQTYTTAEVKLWTRAQ